MPEPKRLYFIALFPPERLKKQIENIRLEFSEKYKCYEALKPPVHITLKAPFFYPEDEENPLVEGFNQLASGCKPFKVELSNFSFFKNHTLYIHVAESSAFNDFQKDLIFFITQQFPDLSLNKYDSEFNPHLTIAYRDIPQSRFKEIKAEYSSQELYAVFEVIHKYLAM